MGKEITAIERCQQHYGRRKMVGQMVIDEAQRIWILEFHDLLMMGNVSYKTKGIQGNQCAEWRKHPALSSANTSSQLYMHHPSFQKIRGFIFEETDQMKKK